MSDERTYFVYRMFNADGDLLYVGCTNNLKRRLTEHKSSAYQDVLEQMARCRIQGPFTQMVALRKERTAAIDEQPLYGWTPQKQSRITKRRSFVRRRMNALMNDGLPFGLSYAEAGRAADRELGVAVSYGEPWRPEVLA